MIARNSSLAAVTLTTLLVLQGCGGSGGSTGDGGGDPPGTGPATATLFCESLADTFAARYTSCAKAAPAWTTEFIQKSQICGRITYAVDNSLATYDAGAAGRCLDFFETATCAELRGFRDDVVFVAGCRDAVKGKGANGTSCKSDYECASSRCDTTLSTPICRSAYTSLAACVTDRACGPGYYCYHGTITDAGLLWYDDSCQPFSNRPGLDQPCTEGTGCQAGLQCEGALGFVTEGSCKAQKTAGSCTTEMGLTAPGYGCLAGTVQPLQGPGEACTGSPDNCGPGLYCGPGSVCAQEPLVGEACDFSDPDKICIGGSCGMVSYTCLEELTPTECFSDWDCDSEGYCENGCNPYRL